MLWKNVSFGLVLNFFLHGLLAVKNTKNGPRLDTTLTLRIQFFDLPESLFSEQTQHFYNSSSHGLGCGLSLLVRPTTRHKNFLIPFLLKRLRYQTQKQTLGIISWVFDLDLTPRYARRSVAQRANKLGNSYPITLSIIRVKRYLLALGTSHT